jgi:hypothetical protein
VSVESSKSSSQILPETAEDGTAKRKKSQPGMCYSVHMPWQFRSRPLEPLERENDELKTTIVVLRREVEIKEGHLGRLQFLLRERLNKIDQLNATIDRLREQNKRLDAEAERYAKMVKLS